MLNQDDYKEEKEIVYEVFKNANSDWNMNAEEILLKYLNPYIQNGLDAIVDDGYLLYVEDVRLEMEKYLQSQITNDVFLEFAISSLFEDSIRKKNIVEKLQNSLRQKYDNYAPIPTRPLEEYIQYADSPKTREEFEHSYHDYLVVIENLTTFLIHVLEKLESSIQTDYIKNQIAALEIFMTGLHSIKDRDFFESLTYKSNLSGKDLFYPECFLSEDSNRILEQVSHKPIDFAKRAKQADFSYSLEDLYQAIPEDIISYELFENEEIDPDNTNLDIAFFQSFYQLALLFCKEANEDENFEETVNHFLVEKVKNFQNDFSDNFYDEDEQDDSNFSYYKGKKLF